MNRSLLLSTLVLAACATEFELTAECTADGDVATCHTPVDYPDAVRGCVELGGWLLEQPATREEALEMGELVRELNGDVVWVAWPYEYNCSVLDELGATSKRPCDELHAFACQL